MANLQHDFKKYPKNHNTITAKLHEIALQGYYTAPVSTRGLQLHAKPSQSLYAYPRPAAARKARAVSPCTAALMTRCERDSSATSRSSGCPEAPILSQPRASAPRRPQPSTTNGTSRLAVSGYLLCFSRSATRLGMPSRREAAKRAAALPAAPCRIVTSMSCRPLRRGAITSRMACSVLPSAF